MDAELRTDSEHQNFVSIYRGFAYVGETLEGYTKDGLRKTYQDIYKTLAGYPPCKQECSRIHKCQFTKWCRTCCNWRKHLLKTKKSPNVPWELTHSWEWPRSYSNIVEVYLPASWQNGDLNIKDIATACFIWENCFKQFHVKPFVVKNIRLFRNKYFAHNTSLKATDLEKTRVFDVLKDLLKDPDVQGHIDVQACIKHLLDIEQGCHIGKWMIAVKDLIEQHGTTFNKLDGKVTNIHQQQNILHACQENIQKGQEYLIQGQDDLRKDIETIQEDIALFKKDLTKLFQKDDSDLSCWFSWMKTCISNYKMQQLILVLLLIVVIVVIPMCRIFVSKHIESFTEKYEPGACISEQYSVPFSQDLPLMGYLNEHEPFVGRQWLMKKVQDGLFSQNSSKSRGIVLVAEMGYGKSAFVSKLLCPGSMKIARDMHKHIVAFHVCKFDVRSTHFPERFIHRLVGFFAKHNAEYGNKVTMFSESHILFNRDSCNKEPEACFDQGVTIPLKQLSTVTDTPWVVVIDAIDECESSGRNQVLDLLSNRIIQLPKWLKFLITTRNVTHLTLLKKIKPMYLYSNDSRNIEDITLFIQMSFPTHTNGDIINEFVYKSEGHFIYIIQALKWIIDKKDNETVPDFPADLGDIYDINFSRQLVGSSYRIPKSILEIICSTTSPVSKSDIYIILRASNIVLTVDEFDQYFKSLSFFLRINGDIRISHQALYFWLIDKSNDNYRISLQNGHSFISKYLFSRMSGNGRKNIVDLAIHVANSGNSTLRKMFLSSTIMERKDSLKEPVLHILIWKTPCVKALELLIHHFPDVNALNVGNVTPSFVAAAKGHTDQLKLLYRKGADLNFLVKGPMLISSYDIFSKLEMMKLHYYSGYSLLHIASQHGYISTVKFILAKNGSLAFVKNTLGLHAGHVACENGHLNVVKKFEKLHSITFIYDCMHYASKHNHKHIAVWLVSKGFMFECISNKRSFEALRQIKHMDGSKSEETDFGAFPNDSLSLEYFINPLDVWWVVFKDNPLMTAIKTGSIDVAKYLLETFQEALVCHDAFGYTAALVSVRFNRIGLYPLFDNVLAYDRCGQIPNHLANDYLITSKIAPDYCPEGGSVSHVIALYVPDDQIYFHIFQNGLRVNWNHSDNFGNYPIHYAVANQNNLFIGLFVKSIFPSERSKYSSVKHTLSSNGSTAYHIAAIHGLYRSLFIISGSPEKPIPDIKDNNGLGITHYVVLRQFDGFVGNSDMEFNLHSLYFLRFLLETSNHSVAARDDFDRNILHYCLRNGHYLTWNYLYEEYNTDFKIMLSQKDINGNNPFDFAIREHSKTHDLILPANDSFYDIYFTSANIKMKDFGKIMSTWELTILSMIQTFSAQDYRIFIEPNLKYIMERSVYLFNAVLVYHKSVNVKKLQSLLINSNENSLTAYMHFLVARHKPLAFISCNRSLLVSPLHYVLLKHNHKDSIFEKTYSSKTSNSFLYLIFKQTRKTYAFHCPDENGFNIFHYSLIGGNIQSARILMRENIRITNSHVNLKDVFLMAMFSRLKSDERNYIKCDEYPFNQTQEKCTDNFLSEVLQENSKLISYNFFCNDQMRDLSLVHLLAINGMAQTLENIAKMFGQKILACRSPTGFTPLYFGRLFRKVDVVSVVSENYVLKGPSAQAEKWLIWSILNLFPQTDFSEPLYHFLNSYPLSSFSFRLFSKESLYVSSFLKKSIFNRIGDFSHGSGKILCYLLSSEIPKILFNIHLLESLYFNEESTSCSSRVALLIQQNKMFQTSVMHITSLQYQYQAKVYHVIGKLLKSFISKCYQVNKLYTQMKTRIANECEKKSSFSFHGVKNYQLIVSARKLCFKLHQFYKSVSISFLMQNGKSLNILVPKSYSYLHFRIKALNFHVHDDFSLLPKLHPFVLINDTLALEHKYLNIIKSTIAYKHLKREFRIKRYIHQTEPHFVKSVLLKEPFNDLE